MDKKEKFEEYKLIHNFLYETPLKSWINEDNFSEQQYKDDWNGLMLVVEKIEDLGYDVIIQQNVTAIDAADVENNGYETKIRSVYYAVVDFIKWYNFKNA